MTSHIHLPGQPMIKTMIALFAIIASPGAALAQYWVEFNPGTCKVGPPPACVVGHWHPVFLPEQLGRTAGAAPGGPAAQKSGSHKESDVVTDVEYESFNIGGAGPQVNGQSVGARAMYLKTGSSGIGGGLIATYNHATESAAGLTSPATNTAVGHAFLSTDLGRLFFSPDQRLNNTLIASAGASFSTFKSNGTDASNINTYGPFASLAYQTVAGAAAYGATLSYSAARSSLLATTAGSWAFGLNGGYAISPTTALSVDYYNLNNGPYVVGGTLTQAFSETFAVTAGARSMVHVTNFSSYKITLGTVLRAY